MAGRRPNSASTNKARGDASKRKHADTPQAAPLESIEVPKELAEDPVAAEHWQRIAPQLKELRLLTPLSLDMYIEYCREKSFAAACRRRAALLDTKFSDETLMEPGPKGEQINRHLEAAEWLRDQALKHEKQAQAWAVEGGLTPSSIRKCGTGGAAAGSSEDEKKQSELRKKYLEKSDD